MKSTTTKLHRQMLTYAVLLAGILYALPQRAFADQIPSGWEASNMKPVGYTGMDGRGGAFKMAIRHVNGRWYLYTGHLWNQGWSVVDVTDPANPEYLKFIPWPHDNTWTIQMEMHDNLMITALQREQANLELAWSRRASPRRSCATSTS